MAELAWQDEKNAFSTSGGKKMRENLSLDERIASAFKDGATSDDVSILIVDVGDASSVANECAERARELLPPCLRPDEIEGQSRAMGDASFAQLYPTFAGKLADLLPRIEANYREVA
jgi:hypothetical protein